MCALGLRRFTVAAWSRLATAFSLEKRTRCVAAPRADGGFVLILCYRIAFRCRWLTGRFIVDPEKRLEIIAPDLDGFKVCLSHTPVRRTLCCVKCSDVRVPLCATK